MTKINESFEVNDLKLVLSPKIHVDEYSSKIGKDSDIIVVSFLVHDKQAAMDLINFIEVGYDFVLDADLSASEIEPGSYLVFVELMRRLKCVNQIFKIIDDLRGASGFKKSDWKFRYINDDEYYPVTFDNFKKMVPLSPKSYKDNIAGPIEEMLSLSGIPIVESIPVTDSELKALQHAAGIA
jgi:hypothetical protein